MTDYNTKCNAAIDAVLALATDRYYTPRIADGMLTISMNNAATHPWFRDEGEIKDGTDVFTINQIDDIIIKCKNDDDADDEDYELAAFGITIVYGDDEDDKYYRSREHLYDDARIFIEENLYILKALFALI